MRPEEGTYLAHRQGNPLLGLFPREHAHFGLRREHRGLHGDGVWMRGDIVGQDQYRRLAIATKWRVTVKTKSGLMRYIFVRNLSTISIVTSGRRSSAGPQPSCCLRRRGRASPGGPAGLRQHGRDHTIGRAPQKVPDEGAANAETHHHELVDAQVIHHTEMVVGICIPRPVDLERAGGLAGIGVAQVRRDAAILSLELRDRVKRERSVKPEIVEFNPPPAMSSKGKPEPASS